MTRRSQVQGPSQSGPETESMRVIMIQFTFGIININHLRATSSEGYLLPSDRAEPHRNLQTLTLSGAWIKIPLKCHRSLLVYYEGVGLLLSWMVGSKDSRISTKRHSYAPQCSGWSKTERDFKSSEYCNTVCLIEFLFLS